MTQNSSLEKMNSPGAGKGQQKTPSSLWDNRPVKYKNVLLSVCSFILVMELAERLSYYGINQGLKNFMKDRLEWKSVSANSLKSTWASLCYLTPLLGAWIADEKWGRFKTIVIFGVWYLVGDFLVAAAAHPSVLEQRTLANVIFMLGLFGGIAIGTGAIKSNVVTLGADQFDPNSEQEVQQRAEYFSWFYWCINLGATVSYSYLAYLCVEGHGFISKEDGYFATYFICALVMLFAIIWLCIGKSRYVMIPPTESALTKLVRVMRINGGLSWGAFFINLGFVVFILSFLINASAAFLGETQEALSEVLTYVASACALFGTISWIVFGIQTDYMNASKSSVGGPLPDHTVEEIKLVVRVLPFAAFMIMWHCVYDQIDANFQSVSQQTDLRLFNKDDSAQVPGAALGLFGTISILIIIPFLEKVVYPLYRCVTGKSPSAFGKVFAGLLISIINMFWAGNFEMIRRDQGPLLEEGCKDPNNATCWILDGGASEPMNNISWIYAIPMYMLVGLAECLINVTALDVFYAEVPEYLKSTCQAINLFMTAMGSNVTSIFTLLFAKYSPDNLNEGNLEYMFFAVGAASIVNLIAYTVVMRMMNFAMGSSKTPAALEANLLENQLKYDGERTSDARKSVCEYK